LEEEEEETDQEEDKYRDSISVSVSSSLWSTKKPVLLDCGHIDSRSESLGGFEAVGEKKESNAWCMPLNWLMQKIDSWTSFDNPVKSAVMVIYSVPLSAREADIWMEEQFFFQF
jgi:hypothetical protein